MRNLAVSWTLLRNRKSELFAMIFCIFSVLKIWFHEKSLHIFTFIQISYTISLFLTLFLLEIFPENMPIFVYRLKIYKLRGYIPNKAKNNMAMREQQILFVKDGVEQWRQCERMAAPECRAPHFSSCHVAKTAVVFPRLLCFSWRWGRGGLTYFVKGTANGIFFSPGSSYIHSTFNCYAMPICNFKCTQVFKF